MATLRFDNDTELALARAALKRLSAIALSAVPVLVGGRPMVADLSVAQPEALAFALMNVSDYGGWLVGIALAERARAALDSEEQHGMGGA